MKKILMLGMVVGLVSGSVWGAATNWGHNLLETYIPLHERTQLKVFSLSEIEEIGEPERQRWISEKMAKYCEKRPKTYWTMVLAPLLKLSLTPDSRQWFDNMSNLTKTIPQDNTLDAKLARLPLFPRINTITPENREMVGSVLQQVIGPEMAHPDRMRWLVFCTAVGSHPYKKWETFSKEIQTLDESLVQHRALNPYLPPIRPMVYRIFYDLPPDAIASLTKFFS